jgi:hypothetical protein
MPLEQAPAKIAGSHGSFARMTSPACRRVIDFSDTRPTLLRGHQALQPQSVCYLFGTGSAQIRRSIWPNKRRYRCPSANNNQ